MIKAFIIGGSYCCLTIVTLVILNGCSSKPEQPKTYTVEIIDMKFAPDHITVNLGDTVMWINKDMMAHDVTEESTKAWSSNIIPPEGSWNIAVTERADYFCSIHVVMKGKLEINSH